MIRGGRREKVSIYEIVVGDIIPLNIGDQVINDLIELFYPSLSKSFSVECIQVPADGVVTSSHSLSIDESSMTGESKIVSCLDLFSRLY